MGAEYEAEKAKERVVDWLSSKFGFTKY
jgi:hypothetical protein